MGVSFQAAKSSFHMQLNSNLSFLCPASSTSQLEISHAMTLQPGFAFDAAHTRMVCAQPGLQVVAAKQTEELQGRHTLIIPTAYYSSGTEAIVTHPSPAPTKQS